jgi:hypothetical protein
MIGAFQGVYLKRKPCPNPVDDDAWGGGGFGVKKHMHKKTS